MRPAKRIETASILGCISLETAQNEMHGGQAIPTFDFYLAPDVTTNSREHRKKHAGLFTPLPKGTDRLFAAASGRAD
ncbi:anaerobic ribonucleoside-triphosphate reductase [Bacteroides sp. KG121]|uniref:anaerobic ribonucleoside-triphosphate reductase n=1 Tax=Bacteroides sp. KG121 TaxID=3397826 RepID=UPI003D9665C3